MSKAALADPSNTELVLDLSHRYLQERQPEKALEILIPATALPDASAKLFARLAMVYASLGKDPQAVEAARRRSNGRRIRWRGTGCFTSFTCSAGRPKEALKILNQAGHEPGRRRNLRSSWPSFTAHGTTSAVGKSGHHHNALTTLQHAANQNPTSPQLRLRMRTHIVCWAIPQRRADLRATAGRAHRNARRARGVHEKLARIYLAGQNYAKAQRATGSHCAGGSRQPGCLSIARQTGG